MLPLGHLAGAYLATKTLLSFFKTLPSKTKRRLLIFGTFITLLPDFDFIYPLLKFGTIFTKKSVFNHHATIFHSLFLWLLISLIIFLWSFFTAIALAVIARRRPNLDPERSEGEGKGRRRSNPVTSVIARSDVIIGPKQSRKPGHALAFIFFFSLLFHLILDSFFIGSGPLWLWPFSQKTYGFIFTPSDISGFSGFFLYLSHPTFYLEILLGLLALVVILRFDVITDRSNPIEYHPVKK